MLKPLALVFYENLFPGSKLVNRLQDLGYRVSVVQAADQLLPTAKTDKAMFVVVDLSSQSARVIQAIGDMRNDQDTSHIPVLAFSGKTSKHLQPEATKAGVSLIADESGILEQLPQLLEHILEV
ncbi:MAG: hypothetical protein JWN25_2827 [Verrucomicrobiales bacterium]|jgi:DNA-binding NtrC family response regulator|nr:hypothetical protein [Verrucomicrobiales bacterium]MDB6131547.1 hypothetical protein [Verrucomicrobiales bacterium]